MKLLKRTLVAVLLAGLPCLAGFTQDAPGTAPAGTPQQPPAPVDSQATGESADADDPDAQRSAMIDAIMEEMELPPQQDTGTINTHDWFVPQAAAETAGATDGVLGFINFITAFFTILILGLMIYFVIRYRRREPDEADPEGVASHSTTLELTWTIIPTCIVLVMFALGFRDFLNQTVSPPNAREIQVLGRMWSWQFTYPNGAISSDLHLRRGEPVRFVLSSSDVIHSFFVPAWRLKKDVVPGRFNQMWATPTTEGVFEIFCTEYCGTNHSRMIAKLFVYDEERFDDWFARVVNIYENPFTGESYPLEQVGAALYTGRGCIGCHSTDGSIQQAPSWKNLWQAERNLADGTTRVADEAYIRQSILQPSSQIVQGWGASMPSYAGQLDERDMSAIIAYIRTLSDDSAEVGETGETVTPADSQSLGGEDPRGPGSGQTQEQREE